MRVLVVGGHGLIGSAVVRLLRERGHEVITAGRSSGDHRVDLTDLSSIDALYEAVGQIDSVVSTTGHVVYKPLSEITAEELLSSFRDKALGQIELVRRGRSRVSPTGSFVVTTGILARVAVPSGAAAAMANGALESFVVAAAAELAPQRINAISPTVLTEAQKAYDATFPGFVPVDGSEVAMAFVRAIEGFETGRVHRLD